MSTEAERALLPCPFCGGDPELDTMQGFRSLAGKIGNRTVVYCLRCTADVGMCHGDSPLYGDDLTEYVIDLWNARATARAPQPEPVCYRWRYKSARTWNYAAEAFDDPDAVVEPLYALSAPSAPSPPPVSSVPGASTKSPEAADPAREDFEKWYALYHAGQEISDPKQFAWFYWCAALSASSTRPPDPARVEHPATDEPVEFRVWWESLAQAPYYEGIERRIALHAWRSALSAPSASRGGVMSALGDALRAFDNARAALLAERGSAAPDSEPDQWKAGRAAGITEIIDALRESPERFGLMPIAQPVADSPAPEPLVAKIKELAYEMSRQDVSNVLAPPYLRDIKEAQATAREFEEAVDALAALAALAAPPVVPSSDQSRAMFVARLENEQKNGRNAMSIADVLALLNDCDRLANDNDARTPGE